MVGNVNEKQTVPVPKRLNLGKVSEQLQRPEGTKDVVTLSPLSTRLQAPVILQQAQATPPLPPALQTIAKKQPQLKDKINDLWERYNRSDIPEDEKQQIFLEFFKLDKQAQGTENQRNIKETKATIRKDKSYNYGPEWKKLMDLIDRAFEDGNYILLDGLLKIADSIIKAKKEISRLSEIEQKLPFGSKLRQLYFDARHALIDQARVLLNGDPQKKASYYAREYNRLMGEAKKLVDQAVKRQSEVLRDGARTLLNKLEGRTGNPLLDRALGEAGLDVTDLPANRQIIRGRAIQEKRQQTSQTLYQQLYKIDPSKAQTIRKKLQDLSQRDPSKIDGGYYRELVQVQREIDYLIAKNNLGNFEKGMDETIKFLGKIKTEYNKRYVEEARGWMGVFARREGQPTRYAWPAEVYGANSPRDLNRRIISHLFELKRTGRTEDFKKAIAELTDISSCRTLDDLYSKLSIVRALLKADMGQYLDLPAFGRSQGKLLDWSSSQISDFLQEIKLNRVIGDANKTIELGKIITSIEVITVAAAVSSVGSAAVGAALGISANTVSGFIFMTGVNAAIFTPFSRFSEVAFGANEMYKTPGEVAKDFLKNWAMFAALGALGKVVAAAPKFASAAKVATENAAATNGLTSALRALGQRAGAGIKSAVSIEGVERAAHGLAALAVEFAGLNALTLIEQVIDAALSSKQKVGDVLTLENLKSIAIQNAIMLLGLKIGGHFPNTRLVGPITQEIMGARVESTKNRIRDLSVEYDRVKSQREAGAKVDRDPSLVLAELEVACNRYKKSIADFNVNGIFDQNLREVDAQLKLVEAEKAKLAVERRFTVRVDSLYFQGKPVEGVAVKDNIVENKKTYREYYIGERRLIRAEVVDRQVTGEMPYETNLSERGAIEIILGNPQGNQGHAKLILYRENGKLYLQQVRGLNYDPKDSAVLLSEGTTTVGKKGAKYLIPDYYGGVANKHLSIKVEGNRVSLQATGDTYVRGIDPATVAKLEEYTKSGTLSASENQPKVNRRVENNTYTYFTKDGKKILEIKAERDADGQLTLSKPVISPEFVGKPEARQALEDFRNEIQFRSDGQGKKLTAQEVVQKTASKKYSIHDGKLYENDKPQDWVTVEQKGKVINLKTNIRGEIRTFAQLGVVKGQLQLQPVGGGISETQAPKMFGERAKQILDIQQGGIVVETATAPSVEPSLAPFVKPGTNVVREHGVFDPQFIMSFREMSNKTPVVFVDLDQTLLSKKPGTQEISVNPDAAAFLAGLKAKGYKVVILSTGTSDYVSGSLKKAGLDGYCDLVIAREAAFDWNNIPFENITKIDEILQAQGVNEMSDNLFMGYSKGNIVGLLVGEKGKAILIDDNHGIVTDRELLEPGLGEYDAIPVRQYDPFVNYDYGTNGPGKTLPEVLAKLPQVGAPATTAKYQIKGNAVVDQSGKPVGGIEVTKRGDTYELRVEGEKEPFAILTKHAGYDQLVPQGGNRTPEQLKGKKLAQQILDIQQGGVAMEKTEPGVVVPSVEKGTAPGIPSSKQGLKGPQAPVNHQARVELADAEFRKDPNQITFDNLLQRLFDASYRTEEKANEASKKNQARHAELYKLSQKPEYQGMPFYEIEMREGAREVWIKADPAERAKLIELCRKLGLPQKAASVIDHLYDLISKDSSVRDNALFIRLERMQSTLNQIRNNLDYLTKNYNINSKRLSLLEAMRAMRIRTGRGSESKENPKPAEAASAPEEKLGFFKIGDGTGRLQGKAMEFAMPKESVFSFRFAESGREIEVIRSEDGNGFYLRDGGKIVSDANGKPVLLKNGEIINLTETPQNPKLHLKIQLQGNKVTITDSSPKGIEYAEELKSKTPEVRSNIAPAKLPPGITVLKSNRIKRYSVKSESNEVGFVEIDLSKKKVLISYVKPGFKGSPEIRRLNQYLQKEEPEIFGMPITFNMPAPVKSKGAPAQEVRIIYQGFEIRTSKPEPVTGGDYSRVSAYKGGTEASYIEFLKNGDTVTILFTGTAEKYRGQGLYSELLREATQSAKVVITMEVANKESKIILLEAQSRGEDLGMAFKRTPLGKGLEKAGFTSHNVRWNQDKQYFEVESRRPNTAQQAAAK